MISLIKTILAIALVVAKYIHGRQAIDQKEAQDAKELLEDLNKAKGSIARLDDAKRKRLRERYNLD